MHQYLILRGSSRQVYTVPHGPPKSLQVDLSVKADCSKTWFPDRSSSFAELSLKTRHKSKKGTRHHWTASKRNQTKKNDPKLRWTTWHVWNDHFRTMTSFDIWRRISWCHTTKSHPMLSFETSQPQEARDRQSWSVRTKSPLGTVSVIMTRD